MMHNLFRLKRKYPPFTDYGCEFGSTVSGLSFVNLQSPFPENDAIYLITIIIFGTTGEVNEQLYIYPEGSFIIQRLLCQKDFSYVLISTFVFDISPKVAFEAI